MRTSARRASREFPLELGERDGEDRREEEAVEERLDEDALAGGDASAHGVRDHRVIVRASILDLHARVEPGVARLFDEGFPLVERVDRVVEDLPRHTVQLDLGPYETDAEHLSEQRSGESPRPRRP